MKQLAMLALLVTGCLLAGVVPGVAKKKPAKPIIETFEATAYGVTALRFEIEEFSTDQDVRELAKAYASGGEDAVESALGRIEKGIYWVQGEAYPIRVARSVSDGGVRTLNIIAVAPDRIVKWGSGEQVFIEHRGYPFAFIQLRFDQQGQGSGQRVSFSKIVFNSEGAIDVEPMTVDSGTNSPTPLANVHAVSH